MTGSKQAVLCIDAGNTLVKWCMQPDWSAGFSADCVTGSIATASLKGSGGGEPWPEILLQSFFGVQKPAAVLLCNVLGSEFEAQLRVFCSQHALPLHVLSVQAYQPVSSGYLQPDSLGKDRWAACLAASQESSNPVNLLVSFGTATTLDALVARTLLPQGLQSDFQPQGQCEWRQLGGYIVPGVQTMLSSLHSNTAELPNVDFMFASTTESLSWPTGTHLAIAQGVVEMQAAMVQSCIHKLENQFRREVAVWLSGGFAQQVLALLPQARLLEHSVFRGLLVDYRLFRKGRP